MVNAGFCSCNDYKCPFNPKNHNNGCTSCIAKCLKAHEIPSCFFNDIGKTTSTKSDYTFYSFAKKVIDEERMN